MDISNFCTQNLNQIKERQLLAVTPDIYEFDRAVEWVKIQAEASRMPYNYWLSHAVECAIYGHKPWEKCA